jgi:RimJ/RimL family protein N-acetyltransferase
LIEVKPGAGNCPALSEVAINHYFARAVLEGLAPGRLWLDDASSPLAAHVLHDYGMALIWGDERALAPIVEHVRAGRYRERDEWLQIDPRWTHLDWDKRLNAVSGGTGPHAQRFTRVNFRFDKSLFLERHAELSPPGGWSLRAMGEQDFDLAEIDVTPRAFWRDAAQFLAHGGGVCAVKDDEVGAIAFSSFRFDDILEIGIETRPAFRGQGLARATAVALIRQCLAARLEPVWSCRKENTASYMLAQNLGFVPTKELPYYRLPALPLT